MGLIAILIAKLLDPVGGLVALVIGAASSNKAFIAVGAFAGAVVSEIALQLISPIKQFNIVIFIIGVIALCAWSAVGHYFVRKRFVKGGE